MNCHEVETWLSAYLDGELDLGRSLEVEGHLAQCESCSRALRRLEEVSALVRTAASYPAPEALRLLTARQVAR